MIDVETVLKGFKSDTKRCILSAFMVTAVVNGLRPMAWISSKWTPNVPDARVRHVTCKHVNFYSVFDTKAISEKDHDALIARYCATRDALDNKVERRIGKALGYLCPNPSQTNGSLTINYRFQGQIVPGSFQQSLSVTPSTMVKVAREKKRYDRVFGDVEFVIVMN